MKRIIQGRQFFIGKRVAKTGISVFITSFICILLGLPAEFAVIAAIITIEPTASDSIRKGLIRMPASAIGAAFAVLYVALWGVSPLSFTMAAISTIYTCKKLKLDDGVLVATLTAVAMIPDVHADYFFSFISRLGTTSIGIVVSSLVNFFILPPKFMPLMSKKMNPSFRLAALVLTESINRILYGKVQSKPSLDYEHLRSAVESIHKLASFQEREWKYHKVSLSEYRHFFKLKKIQLLMQKIVLHLGNLQYIREKANFTEEEKKLLLDFSEMASRILQDPSHYIHEEHYLTVYELDKVLRYEAEKINWSKDYFHHFTARRIILFELLSLHDCLEELESVKLY